MASTGTDIARNLEGTAHAVALVRAYLQLSGYFTITADPAGNYLVAYYDRRDDPEDNLYRVYATRISAAGNNLSADSIVYDPLRRADPRKYRALFGIPYSLGEYQDLVYWNGNWYGATTYLPAPVDGGSGDGDIYTYKLSAATLRGDFDGNGYSDLLWRKTMARTGSGS